MFTLYVINKYLSQFFLKIFLEFEKQYLSPLLQLSSSEQLDMYRSHVYLRLAFKIVPIQNWMFFPIRKYMQKIHSKNLTDFLCVGKSFEEKFLFTPIGPHIISVVYVSLSRSFVSPFLRLIGVENSINKFYFHKTNFITRNFFISFSIYTIPCQLI